jgi:hypothetical protein
MFGLNEYIEETGSDELYRVFNMALLAACLTRLGPARQRRSPRDAGRIVPNCLASSPRGL